jgi:putative tricarboxylic transport membrane protein
MAPEFLPLTGKERAMRKMHRAGALGASMRLGALGIAVVVAAACTGGGGGSPAAASFPEKDISIMAPADPGGGWDSTARAMQQALESGVTDKNVEVYNVGGAGGTVGLAEFVETKKGDPHQLMVMGLVMVGAIRTNKSPVDLTSVTPIASLTAEQEAIAVKADSKYETFEQLMEDFKADARSVSWAGGSAGGTDQILVGLLAKAEGVAPSDINYIPHSGGGEALAAILSGAATAGVSGVSEFTEQVEAGEMRILAVSGDEAVEGVDAPTIKESGVDVVLDNWRGVMAPPDISSEQRDAVVGLVTELHDSEAWTEALETNGWSDFFRTGDEYASFVQSETGRVEGVLKDIGLIE